jgi:hypothetical protein
MEIVYNFKGFIYKELFYNNTSSTENNLEVKFFYIVHIDDF